MNIKQVLASGVLAAMVAGTVGLAIGGAEAAGFFKEASGFDAAGSNGRTDVIKAQGSTKWGAIEARW